MAIVPLDLFKVGDYTTFYHLVNIYEYFFWGLLQNFIIGRMPEVVNSFVYKCLRKCDGICALVFFCCSTDFFCDMPISFRLVYETCY